MSAPKILAEVRRWLDYAYQDLQAARAMLVNPNFEPRHACWLAQQAAEKTIKAALVYEQIDFPWRHDLEMLCNLLPTDWEGRASLPDLAGLTEWAIEARYPGNWLEPSHEDAQHALRQAEGVWDALSADFSRRGLAINTN